MNEKLKNKIKWSCYCENTSRHHNSKYKHYMRIVKKIDITKNNGYAFEGEFLNYRQQHWLNKTDFVHEYACGDNYFYRADLGRENAITWSGRINIDIILQCHEYMQKFKDKKPELSLKEKAIEKINNMTEQELKKFLKEDKK